MHPAAPGLLKNRRKFTVSSSANSVLNGGVGSGGESAICCRFESSTGGLRCDLRLRDSSAARRALICVRVAATSLSLLEIFLRLPMVHPFHLTLAIIEQQLFVAHNERVGIGHHTAVGPHDRSEEIVAHLSLVTNREERATLSEISSCWPTEASIFS